MLFFERLESLEEPADLGVGETVVCDPPERRELFRPDRRAARRHHGLLVPAEDRRRLRQVGYLGEAGAELVECGRHSAGHYRSRFEANTPFP